MTYQSSYDPCRVTRLARTDVMPLEQHTRPAPRLFRCNAMLNPVTPPPTIMMSAVLLRNVKAKLLGVGSVREPCQIKAGEHQL